MSHVAGFSGGLSRGSTCSWIMNPQENETSSVSTATEPECTSKEALSETDTSSTFMFPENGKLSLSKLDRVRFNIRGIKYEVDKECLRRAPASSKLANLPAEHYDCQTGEYYFNRDPYIFNSFVNYLVNGDMHYKRCVCVDELEKEMAYWGFDDFLLQHCCWERAESEKTRRLTMKLVEQEWFGMVLDFENKKPSEVAFRDKLWLFLEEPASSVGAQVIVAYVSVWRARTNLFTNIWYIHVYTIHISTQLFKIDIQYSVLFYGSASYYSQPFSGCYS